MIIIHKLSELDSPPALQVGGIVAARRKSSDKSMLARGTGSTW